MRRDLYEPDHEAFREVVQAYIKREVTPNQQRWEEQRSVDRQAWLAAGKQAIIGLLIPETFGGAGTDPLAEKLHRDWRHISFARLLRTQALRTPGLLPRAAPSPPAAAGSAELALRHYRTARPPRRAVVSSR